jgi:hypothetical protein
MSFEVKIQIVTFLKFTFMIWLKCCGIQSGATMLMEKVSFSLIFCFVLLAMLSFIRLEQKLMGLYKLSNS